MKLNWKRSHLFDRGTIRLYCNVPFPDSDEKREFLSTKLMFLSSRSDYRDIYICGGVEKITRKYMKIQKSKGNKISFGDAIIDVCVKGLNHENMHKIIIDTEGVYTTEMYDVFKGGYRDRSGSCGCDTSIYKDDILP